MFQVSVERLLKDRTVLYGGHSSVVTQSVERSPVIAFVTQYIGGSLDTVGASYIGGSPVKVCIEYIGGSPDLRCNHDIGGSPVLVDIHYIEGSPDASTPTWRDLLSFDATMASGDRPSS